MWLQSVLQANCCWEASLLLWIKHYCQCIKKPCCILPSPPSLFLIITKELLLVQSFAKKAFSTHEGDSSCALWWDQGGVADSNESLQKNKVLTKPQGRMTRLKSASKTWLSSWRRIIDLNLQLNGTHTHTQTNTRRFKAHEYEYVEPKMRRTLWADPWGADYAEGEIFLIQIKCHVLCGGKKKHFYKHSSASTTVELKKETESMFSLKYFACAITVTMVTGASNDLSGWIYTK